jgi:hypothetical protein
MGSSIDATGSEFPARQSLLAGAKPVQYDVVICTLHVTGHAVSVAVPSAKSQFSGTLMAAVPVIAL